MDSEENVSVAGGVRGDLGDEHVEEDDHHGDVVDSVQHVADVLDELVVVLQHHGDHFGQPEDGPEQSLKALLHPSRKLKGGGHFLAKKAESEKKCRQKFEDEEKLFLLLAPQYEYRLNMPIMKATKTMMNMTMNLKISLTVRPSEICKGPKLSFAGRM
ncbi:hypothetical protein EYF80_043504 [Liparis tanakae]|uniref:Uncharacterized protein n=1 Tax=Liparis tanakae TaxID=230148 RepID=A0A4Z2FYD6_9TELE|nr:hypothetical protein EYF80_043504 [Liparis tanakae]